MQLLVRFVLDIKSGALGKGSIIYGQSPYVIGQTIYIFILSFVLSSSSFFLPNLSRRRVDVCHTCTHGVALVRI